MRKRTDYELLRDTNQGGEPDDTQRAARSKMLKAARDKRYGLKKRGWVVYPHTKSNGELREDLDTIMQLLGSTLYESRGEDGVIWIRRVED